MDGRVVRYALGTTALGMGSAQLTPNAAARWTAIEEASWGDG
jgi:hypothetical protein